jgi:ureidoglycolate hydrolase
MFTTTEIRLEAISLSSFGPFGQVIGQFDSAPSYSAKLIEAWRLHYEVDGPTDVLFIKYTYGPLECASVERHFNVTQSFVALANAPSIMVVAAPTDRSSVPGPKDLHAFYVPGSVGIMLWKGTWHARTRFPVRPPGAAFVLLTGSDTQRELESCQINGTPPKLTEVLDLTERYATTLRITDPAGLL